MEAFQFAHYVLLGAVIAGITEFISRLRGKDYWAAVTIAVSALVGMIFGLNGIEGLNPVTGLAAGFGVSGALSAIGMLGNRSAVTPRDAITK